MRGWEVVGHVLEPSPIAFALLILITVVPSTWVVRYQAVTLTRVKMVFVQANSANSAAFAAAGLFLVLSQALADQLASTELERASVQLGPAC